MTDSLDDPAALPAVPASVSLEEDLRQAIYALESCDWTDAEMFAGESVISRLDVLNAIRAVCQRRAQPSPEERTTP